MFVKDRLTLKGSIETIEAILAFTLLCLGVYAFSVIYQSYYLTNLGETFEIHWVRYILGTWYILSGLSYLSSFLIKNKRLKEAGTFLVAIALFSIAVLRVLAFGLTPLFWLLPLSLTIIAGYSHLVLKVLRDD